MNLDIRKLQRAIVDGLEDVKAQNIAVFNTEHLSPLFERVIIATGSSNRQTKALASSVRDAVKGQGMPVMRTEGEENGEWIIVDCGAAVVHVMQPAIRDYYHLEEIWGGKPVKMKIDSTPLRLVKAEAPAKAAPAGKTAARKAPAVKKAPTAAAAAAKKAPARKAVAEPAPARKAAAKPVVAKKAPARKTPVRSAVTRTVGVKSAAAPAKPTAVKASPARKAAPAKKAAAKTGAAPARKRAAKA